MWAKETRSSVIGISSSRSRASGAENNHTETETERDSWNRKREREKRVWRVVSFTTMAERDDEETLERREKREPRKRFIRRQTTDKHCTWFHALSFSNLMTWHILIAQRWGNFSLLISLISVG